MNLFINGTHHACKVIHQVWDSLAEPGELCQLVARRTICLSLCQLIARRTICLSYSDVVFIWYMHVSTQLVYHGYKSMHVSLVCGYKSMYLSLSWFTMVTRACMCHSFVVTRACIYSVGLPWLQDHAFVYSVGLPWLVTRPCMCHSVGLP